jgi:transposase
MAGKKGLKKRFWSNDEKRTICVQTLTPGVSVAQVARRYSMNANLIFRWLKDPRFAPAEGGSSPEESIALEGVFLPVEIETPALERPTAPAPMTDMAADPGSTVLAQRVDIALSELLPDSWTDFPVI